MSGLTTFQAYIDEFTMSLPLLLVKVRKSWFGYFTDRHLKHKQNRKIRSGNWSALGPFSQVMFDDRDVVEVALVYPVTSCTGTWLENPKYPYLPILIGIPHENDALIWDDIAVRIESVKFWLALNALPSHPELKYLFNNVTVNYSTYIVTYPTEPEVLNLSSVLFV